MLEARQRGVVIRQKFDTGFGTEPRVEFETAWGVLRGGKIERRWRVLAGRAGEGWCTVGRLVPEEDIALLRCIVLEDELLGDVGVAEIHQVREGEIRLRPRYREAEVRDGSGGVQRRETGARRCDVTGYGDRDTDGPVEDALEGRLEVGVLRRLPRSRRVT